MSDLDNNPNELIREDKSTGIQVRVEWTELGEGLSGDYNPDDPDDVELLRFDVSIRHKDEDWEFPDDSSYCTQVPVDTDEKSREKGLEMIMDYIFEPIVKGQSIKKLCEELSWIDPEVIKSGVWKVKSHIWDF